MVGGGIRAAAGCRGERDARGPVHGGPVEPERASQAIASRLGLHNGVIQGELGLAGSVWPGGLGMAGRARYGRAR